MRTFHLFQTSVTEFSLMDEQMMTVLGGFGSVNLVASTVNALPQENETIRVVTYDKSGMKGSMESAWTHFVSKKRPYVHKVI